MKNWWLSAAVSFALIVGCQTGIAPAQQPPERDIGSEVRGIFAVKCASCHGPELPKPKGRFGYVLDLQRIAANPEMVIRKQPTESELWVLVERNEMPPADSPHGALTSAQKEIIRTWIADGAPDASFSAINAQGSVGSEPMDQATTELDPVDRLIRWLGKFHLLLLHFPIALVLAAGVAESWSAWQRKSVPSETVRFCLWLGALAAIPTAGLGWLFAASGNGMSSPLLLIAHRWLGTTAAMWLLVTAACAERDARREERSRRVRYLLASGVLITVFTAHLGGLLDRGVDYFAF